MAEQRIESNERDYFEQYKHHNYDDENNKGRFTNYIDEQKLSHDDQKIKESFQGDDYKKCLYSYDNISDYPLPQGLKLSENKKEMSNQKRHYVYLLRKRWINNESTGTSGT